MSTQLNRFCFFVAATLAFITSAQAQSQIQAKLEARATAAINKLQAACGDDVKKYCSTVTPGEGRLLLCLEAHEDKTSDKCNFGLFEAAHNLSNTIQRIDAAANICWSDIEKYCANTQVGGGRVIQCLVDKKTSVKPACRAVVTKFMAQK